jgi:hypothetical protein
MFDSWRPSGSDREPTDGFVAVLQRELLTPVHHDVATAHLEAMALELDLSRPSVEPERHPRRLSRAVLGAIACAGALTFTGGLGAAGALPAHAQHWLSNATRVFGIHIPDRPAPSAVGSEGNPPRVVPASSPTPAGRSQSRTSTARRAGTSLPRESEVGPAPKGTEVLTTVPLAPAAPGGGTSSADTGKSQAAQPADSNAADGNAPGNGKAQAAARASSNATIGSPTKSNAAGSDAESQAEAHASSNAAGALGPSNISVTATSRMRADEPLERSPA